MRKENLYAHGPTMWFTLKFQVVATKKKNEYFAFFVLSTKDYRVKEMLKHIL